MRTRVARYGKIYVFSDGELPPFSCKWYFEYLKTTETGKRKNKGKKNDFTKPLKFTALINGGSFTYDIRPQLRTLWSAEKEAKHFKISELTKIL